MENHSVHHSGVKNGIKSDNPGVQEDKKNEQANDQDDRGSERSNATCRSRPNRNGNRYGIKQSLQKHSLKYEPVKVEQPKLPVHVCSPCSRERRVRTASNYCTNCTEKLCGECTVQHNKFQLLVQHKVVPVSEAPRDESSEADPVKFKLQDKCPEHGTKVVDRYCPDHDTVGCVSCMTLNHSRCTEPEYITKVCIGLLKTNVVKEMKQEVVAKRKDVKAMKDKRVEDKKRFTTERDEIMATIVGMRKRINAKFDGMEREALEKLNAKYEGDVKGMTVDIKKCEDAINILDAAFQRLKETNEAQLFVNMKRDAKGGMAKGDTAIQRVLEHLGRESVVFNVDENIDEWLNKLAGLGKYDHEKSVFVGSFYAKVEGNMESDTNKTDYIINGLVNLPGGCTILADWGNKRLKMLDKSYYNICSHVDLQGAPFSICMVSDNEIAVSIRDEKVVQFVSINDKTMSPSRKFKIDEYCRGITHRNGEMYISCGGGEGEVPGQLRVYNMAGVLQRVYDEDTHGQKLFKSPKDILINNEGTRIHVADRQKGVITLSFEGRYQSTFKVPELKTPYGLTMDSLGNLFVIGYESNNVIQLDSGGKKLSVVLKENDGVVRPIAVCCHESVSNRLLVSTEKNNEIKVFTLQEK